MLIEHLISKLRNVGTGLHFDVSPISLRKIYHGTDENNEISKNQWNIQKTPTRVCTWTVYQPLALTKLVTIFNSLCGVDKDPFHHYLCYAQIERL